MSCCEPVYSPCGCGCGGDPSLAILLQLQAIQKTLNCITLKEYEQDAKLTKIITILQEMQSQQQECCKNILIAIDEKCTGDCSENWHSNVQYYVGDIVKKGDNFYRCIKSHLSNGTNAPPDSTYWEAI